ncbi:S1 family peptidase [Segnochrobactrum spirostomi]|uniref:S1 family peptidase n=1 Tax=Segnochrobactrum spirostomi TaxID=2608987 RepID=UPI0028AD319C|nr:serine protease [Segnochrobactrum spirostomi]
MNEFVNLDRKFIRNIRSTLYSIEKFGIAKATDEFISKHAGKGTLHAHLRGEIEWHGHIRGRSDPVFRKNADRFNLLFKPKILVEPTYEEIRKFAVWIVDNNTACDQGTCFFVHDIGLITAAHCVEGATDIDVYNPLNPTQKYKANVQKIDKHLDLAILSHSIPTSQYRNIKISKVRASVGQSIIAAGYPDYGPGDSLSIRTGTVCSLSMKSGVGRVEVTQKLSSGMSGGPLIDRDNCVFGVIHKGGSTEEKDIAVEISELTKLVHA